MDITFAPSEATWLQGHRRSEDLTIEAALHRLLTPIVEPAITDQAVVTPPPIVTAARRSITWLDLVPPDPRGYGVDAVQGHTFALQNYAGAAAGYTFPGSALSASARAWPGTQLTGMIVQATWRLVWNPLGDLQAGAQLSHVAAGPSDEQIIAEFTGRSEATPIHVWQDVTAGMQALQARGADRFVCHKLRGAAVIFASTLEVIWEW